MVWQTALKPLVALALFFASSQAAALLPRQGDPEACPGYKASNVKSDGGAFVSADLNLAEAPCNVYGTDLDNLKVLVEYQSREWNQFAVYFSMKS
jgi:alpha-glucosidase